MQANRSCANHVYWVIAVYCSCLTGCNSDSGGKSAVSGTVRYADAPIEVGEIRFFPIQGTQGNVTGAQIRAGKFELSRDKGLNTGTYRIEVRGYRNRDGSQGEVDLTNAEAAYVQYIPAKYNMSSQQTVNVEAEDPHVDLELALTK